MTSALSSKLCIYIYNYIYIYTSLITGRWVHTSLFPLTTSSIIQTGWRIYNQKHTLTQFRAWKVDLKIGPSDLWCAASGAGAGAGTSGTVAAKPIRRSAGGVMFFFPHWFGGRDGRMAVWCCGTLQGWIGLEKFWKQSLRVTVRHAHRGESSPSVVHHGYFPYYKYKEIVFVAVVRFIILILSWFLIFIKDQ